MTAPDDNISSVPIAEPPRPRGLSPNDIDIQADHSETSSISDDKAGVVDPTPKSTTGAVAALYEPGNETLCRKLLDRAVASEPRTFTLGDPSGPLVILRVPDESTLPSLASWGGDLPGTTLATAADIIERAQTIPWVRRGRGGGLTKIHAP